MRGLVTELLTRFIEEVYRTAHSRSQYRGADIPTERFNHVTEFWEQASRWNTDKPPTQYIELTGTISTLAPALPGVPRRKRDLHREVRRSIPQIVAHLRKQGHGVGPASIDALLAYTSGQMVVQLASQRMPYAYLGMYHSIVRNSIPLFVRQDYHCNRLIPALHNNHDSAAIEARVVARLLPTPDDYLLSFLRETGLSKVFNPSMFKRVASRFALQVDGDDGTEIEPLGECRYIDGDIWVALRVGETERVVSRFLDLSDPADIRAEREGLREDAQRFYGGAEVIAEYDQTQRIFDTAQIVDPVAIYQQVYRDSVPKPERAPRRRRTVSAPQAAQQVFNTYIFDSKVEGVSVSKERFQIHNVGGIVNVKASLRNVKQVIGSSGLDKERNAELEKLIEKLQAALEKLPAERAEDADRVVNTAGLVVTEALKKNPDPSFLKLSAEGLKQAAEAVKDAAPAVLGVVGMLLKFLVH
ncbi:MAG: hypothetical protein AABM64_07060 [Pseudomonadota bacterium]